MSKLTVCITTLALSQATSCTFNATGTFVDACANGYGPDKAGKECKVRRGCALHG